MALVITANNVATAVVKGGGTRTNTVSASNTIDRGGLSSISSTTKGVDINSGNPVNKDKNRFKQKYLRLLSTNEKTLAAENVRYSLTRRLINTESAEIIGGINVPNPSITLGEENAITDIAKIGIPTVG